MGGVKSGRFKVYLQGEELAFLLSKYKTLTAAELAKAMGIDERLIRRELRARGLAPFRKTVHTFYAKLSSEQINKLPVFLDELGVSRTAKLLGISANSVSVAASHIMQLRKKALRDEVLDGVSALESKLKRPCYEDEYSVKDLRGWELETALRM